MEYALEVLNVRLNKVDKLLENFIHLKDSEVYIKIQQERDSLNKAISILKAENNSETQKAK